MDVIKEASVADTGGVTPEDLELINKYAKKPLSEDEVFVFSVLLCDNETDRDFERFTPESLYRLSELFCGKTGIFDHSWQSSNQAARIYKTEVVMDSGRLTSYGEAYVYLKAGAYMVKTKDNEALIAEINGGIKKEVSVGCSVRERLCSICGKDIDSPECPHSKGSTYNGKLCAALLSDPTDAYEWSFVAVPAQKNAGVIKSRGGKMPTLREYVKDSECGDLLKELDDTEKYGALGKKYLESLRWETAELAIKSGSGFKKEFLTKMFSKMEEEELLTVKAVYEKRLDESFPITFQLFKGEDEGEKFSGEEFLI